jgi:hypothetical protein
MLAFKDHDISTIIMTTEYLCGSLQDFCKTIDRKCPIMFYRDYQVA